MACWQNPNQAGGGRGRPPAGGRGLGASKLADPSESAFESTPKLAPTSGQFFSFDVEPYVRSQWINACTNCVAASPRNTK